LQWAASSPQTLGTALHTTRSIAGILQQTDNFVLVAPRLEASRSVFAREGDLDLVLQAREKGWFFAKTSTEVGNGEATAGATVRVRNVFGGAETLEGNLSAGTKTRRSFQGTLSAPLAEWDPTLRTNAVLSVFNLQRDNSSYSSSSEDSIGLKAAVTVRSVSHRNISHVPAHAAFSPLHSVLDNTSLPIILSYAMLVT
jgi:outer membrane protein insertion porin family